jgi:hypothetical protein
MKVAGGNGKDTKSGITGSFSIGDQNIIAGLK